MGASVEASVSARCKGHGETSVEPSFDCTLTVGKAPCPFWLLHQELQQRNNKKDIGLRNNHTQSLPILSNLYRIDSH